jgi:hypothetical protein
MSNPVITRQQIVRGSASLAIGAVANLFSQEPVSAGFEMTTSEKTNDAYGKLDEVLRDCIGKITWRPDGTATANILEALFPSAFATPSIGTSLFGSTDVATVVHSLAGTKVTFHSTAVTRMPSLRLNTQETAFSGDCEITALVKNATARTAANSVYTIETAAHPAVTYDIDNLLGGYYLGAWGTGGDEVEIQPEDGWDVEFDVDLEQHVVDGAGTVNYSINGVSARAKCRPINLSETDIVDAMNIQDSGAVIGASMRSGKDLVIAATGGLTVTLREAELRTGPLSWGRNELRVGEIGFEAHRKIESGLPTSLFSVALTA